MWRPGRKTGTGAKPESASEASGVEAGPVLRELATLRDDCARLEEDNRAEKADRNEEAGRIREELSRSRRGNLRLATDWFLSADAFRTPLAYTATLDPARQVVAGSGQPPGGTLVPMAHCGSRQGIVSCEVAFGPCDSLSE